MDDLEKVIKIIVVGNGGVGKSSMTALYCKGVFTSTYKKTIGVDFLEKEIDLGAGESVRLMIWDTAGQEEFDALTAGYYRGAGACAIVFSTIDRASFEAVERWKRKVEEACGPIPLVLVQNKIDLMNDAKMTAAEVEALAKRLNLRLYRACVKENVKVNDVFEYLAEQYIRGGGDTSGVGAVAAAGEYSAAGDASSVGEGKTDGATAHEQVTSDEKDAPAPASYSERTSAPAPAPAPELFPTPVRPTISAPAPAPAELPPPLPPRPRDTVNLQADRTEKITKKKSAFSWC